MDFIVSSTDFESLPPAVQRKFFSNLERFRLLTTQSARHNAHPRREPPPRRTKTPITTNKHYPRAHLQRRPRSAARYCTFDQTHESWQCFHSLPPKLQKFIFSKEEQRLFQRTAPVSDAADQAVLKFEERRRISVQESRSHCCSGLFDEEFNQRTPRGRTSLIPSLTSDRTSSADLSDSGIEMDKSILDSFRWLDEDEDLDLSFDSYHKYVSDTAASQSQNAVPQKPSTPRQAPSLRRTLSLAKNRNSISLGNRTLNSSQSSTVPFSSGGGHSHNHVNRNTYHGSHNRHASNPTSIDPAAQYYQDPEARLKLRVYLASPQKFDEAIEFGFPSLDNNNNNKENMNSSTWRQGPTRDSKRISQISVSTQGWTFLDDDTTSIDLSLFDYTHERQRQLQPQHVYSEDPAFSSLPELKPSTAPGAGRRPLPVKPSTSAGNTAGHRREMTLKMTLTRPDLRTHTADPLYDDPLRLAELPPADETKNIWDDLPEDRGVVKKMWRKIRGLRD